MAEGVRTYDKNAISAKRYLRSKKHIQQINKRLKKKGLPTLKYKAASKPATKQSRFPKNYLVQQGKTKLRLRKTKCLSKRNDKPRMYEPGTIFIIVAGPHKGKRVVFIKSLKSGMVLVTGPFKCNGVPLRRFNPAYMVKTKLCINLAKVDIPDHLNDDYFKRLDLKVEKTDSDKLFGSEEKKYTVSEQRRNDQKTIDKQICEAIKSHPESKMVHAYLRSLFSLGKYDYPHLMTF